jgi:hypothetical protein
MNVISAPAISIEEDFMRFSSRVGLGSIHLNLLPVRWLIINARPQMKRPVAVNRPGGAKMVAVG